MSIYCLLCVTLDTCSWCVFGANLVSAPWQAAGQRFYTTSVNTPEQRNIPICQTVSGTQDFHSIVMR